VHLRGLVAWIAWLFIHILLLIGFRNRVLVLVQWAWEYWTFERGPRLITGEVGDAAGHRPGSSSPAKT
jgi:NADH:ubiquinone reductase (H+-translocating)